MGLFDYMRCELPLQLEDSSDSEFQTNDTPSQYMMRHTITADGRLVLHDYVMEDTPKAERPYPDAPEDSILALCGCIRPKEDSRKDVDLDWDGDIHFGEYRATFRKGFCVEMSMWKSEQGSWDIFWNRPVPSVSPSTKEPAA